MSLVLCYNEKKGLYLKNCSGEALPSEGLFREHDKSGYKTNVIKVPGTSMEIAIHSNLHYCRASYLYASILKDGKYILNLEDVDKMYSLSHHAYSVQNYSVEPGEWCDLFLEIINHHRENLKIDTVSKYFEELDKFIDSSSVSLVGRISKPGLTTNMDEYSMLNHASSRLVNLIESVPQSTLCDIDDIYERLLKSCDKFITRFHNSCMDLNLDRPTPSLEKFSKNLRTIVDYMDKQGGPMEFLQTLQKTCKQIE